MRIFFHGVGNELTARAGVGKVSAETGSAQEKVDCYNPILLKNSRSPFDSAQGERGGDL